ncbi:MAG: tyrosine--tRNA ligase [Rickettsiales bacterium]|jgi:tyrosyl-tRNA synthetase|nr:tyrosine--tRNA ligase [Rickettsiales bacterium]
MFNTNKKEEKMNLTTQQRFDLITRNCEEVIGADDLMYMLETGLPLNYYIGFEISGRPHIGQAVTVMQKYKDMMDAGINCRFFFADWHSYINNKLDGNLNYIEEIADGYFKEIFKAALLMLGGDPEKFQVVKASELYQQKPDYWLTFLEVCKSTSPSRIARSISIMGRQEGEISDFAFLVYPPMQVADIFAMNINIAHGGIDQRKIHVIMRDCAKSIRTNAPHLGDKFMKPAVIHTPILPSLLQPPVWPIPEGTDLKQMQIQMKMSKSNPLSAMYIDDTVEDVRKKVMKGFCAEREIGYNPVLTWVKMIIFDRDNQPVTIVRPEQHGGDITFENYADLEQKFAEGLIHPIDVKNFLADYLINLFAPAREYFSKSPYKEMKARTEEILAKVNKKK